MCLLVHVLHLFIQLLIGCEKEKRETSTDNNKGDVFFFSLHSQNI